MPTIRKPAASPVPGARMTTTTRVTMTTTTAPVTTRARNKHSKQTGNPATAGDRRSLRFRSWQQPTPLFPLLSLAPSKRDVTLAWRHAAGRLESREGSLLYYSVMPHWKRRLQWITIQTSSFPVVNRRSVYNWWWFLYMDAAVSHVSRFSHIPRKGEGQTRMTLSMIWIITKSSLAALSATPLIMMQELFEWLLITQVGLQAPNDNGFLIFWTIVD